MSVVDGIELRNQIAEDYFRNAKRIGGEGVTMAEAEKLAAVDLMTVDVLDREAPAVYEQKKSTVIDDDPGPAREQISAEKMAADVGGRFERRAFADAGPIETLSTVNPERRLKLTNRVWELCRREGSVYVYPAFANAIAVAHADWNMNCKGYRHLRTKVEKDKAFFRALSDICDRSNSILPNWWVK